MGKETILVTGGAGFIGSHLVESLLQEDYRVICLDNFNDSYSPLLKEQNIRHVLENPDFELIRGDILDIQLLHDIFSGNIARIPRTQNSEPRIKNLTPKTQDLRPIKVIHLAAMAGVCASLISPDIYIDVDVKGTLNLLEVVRNYDVKQFIFASSSSVYGINKKVPFSPDDLLPLQVSPYAAAKRCAELYCRTYHHLYNIPITILRLFTVYGPRQRPDMAIRKFISLIFDDKPIPVFGDGKSRRDYTYVSDCIESFMKAMNKPMDFEIFNIGSGKLIELQELINLLERETGREVKMEHLDNQAGDVPITYADISKTRRILDYNPKISIEEGVKRFVEWYKKEYKLRKE